MGSAGTGGPDRTSRTTTSTDHEGSFTMRTFTTITGLAIAITALALLTDAILRFAESMTAIARARRAELR